MAVIGREAARAPLTSADINDGIVGAADLASTLDLSSKTLTMPTISSLTLSGNLSVDGGTIKLDGNYPVGSANVALGDTALDDASLTGGNNTAIGSGSLTSNTSGANNSAVGQFSLYSNTTGASNSALGAGALAFNSAGASNTAVGQEALRSNTTASNNTAVGYQSLYANTTGTSNVAVGASALASNTTASNNSAFGYFALEGNTTGANNNAFGYGTLYQNTTGSSNTAFGHYALQSITTGTGNTALGYQAGYNSTGNYNTYLGWGTGFTATGSNNTFLGFASGYSVTTGQGNTFVGSQGFTGGYGAGYYMTTGSNNTIIGAFTGNQGGLDIRTSSNHIVLSDGDGNPRFAANSSGQVCVGDSISFGGGGYTGTQFTVNADTNDYSVAFRTNTSTVGNAYGIFIHYPLVAPNGNGNQFLTCNDSTASRAIIRSNGGIANYQANDVNLSDERVKTDIAPLGSMWDKFKALEIVTFKYKDQTHDDPNIGVIAQQVEAVAPEFVDNEGFGETPEGEEPLKTIYTADLYHAAIKALQEAMTRIETLEAEVAALKGA